MRPAKRRPRWIILFSAALLGCSVFVLLDAFVIPRPQAQVEVPAGESESKAAQSQSENASQVERESETEQEAEITATSYESEGVSIQIETVRAYDTTLYIADIRLADPSSLKTALARDTFGRNVKEATSEIAGEHSAILAINGDFYGSRDDGYVIRNGVLYRETADDGSQALVIDSEGNFSIVNEGDVSAAELLAAGARQVLSFGPALVVDGQVAVDGDDEVSKAKSSNPRTALGQVGQGHYIFIVSDGRSEESEGLTLLQLARVMADRGVQTAYNLDGGGSSTMVFGGEVINNPVGGRGGESERQVSDIVYIG